MQIEIVRLVPASLIAVLSHIPQRRSRVSWPMRRENRTTKHHRFLIESSFLILLPGVDELSTWAHIYFTYLRVTYIYYIYIIYTFLSRTACIHSSSPQTARTNLAVVHAVLSQSLFLSILSHSLSLCLFLSPPPPPSISHARFPPFPLYIRSIPLSNPREITCQKCLIRSLLTGGHVRNPESVCTTLLRVQWSMSMFRRSTNSGYFHPGGGSPQPDCCLVKYTLTRSTRSWLFEWR